MDDLNRLAAIILAAGEGKRMKSKIPKVLHCLGGIPILHYPLGLVEALHAEISVVVVGHCAEAVTASLEGKSVQTVLQSERKGTADAVLQTAPLLKDFVGCVFILKGDTPLISQETLTRLLKTHQGNSATVTLLTANLFNPKGYGRIIRGKGNTIDRIVEEKDGTDEERKIGEINSGTYIVESAFLFDALRKVSPVNAQKEYYLTDIIKIAKDSGEKVIAVITNEEEVFGINSRADLARAEGVIQKRIRQYWMDAGVTLVDPSQVRIDAQVTIGRDSVLYPGVSLEGKTKIGEGCQIHASRIKDSRLDDNVLVRDYCVIDTAEVESDVTIGPFAHLRPQTILRCRSKVGNFVEIKKSELGEGAKANHLSYLGDAKIGRRVNIGAGVITCNYDGHKKSQTIIEDDVFIGSDTQFVAPVTIGSGSLIAAGSTVTHDVEPNSLVISRGKQTTKAGWTKKIKKEKQEK